MKIVLFKAHTGDPLSMTIKAVTQSPYCHAAILIDQDSPYRSVFTKLCGLEEPAGGGHLIAELYWPKARARFLAPDELAHVDLFQVKDWSPFNDTFAMQYALTVIREEVAYDIPDLFRFLPMVRLIMGEVTEEVARRHMFCSFFAFEVCKHAGRPLLKVDGAQVTPNMLAWPNEVEQVFWSQAFQPSQTSQLNKEIA